MSRAAVREGTGTGTARITFGWLKPDELQADPNFDDLISAQYEEFGTLPPEVDWERMQAAARAGYFAAWAAKDEGQIVAWAQFNLGPHYHYSSTKFAWDCGHYCHRDYRPWTWIKMMRGAICALHDMNVKMVILHTNPRRPLDAVIVRRLGFEPHGQMYRKVL